MKHLVLGVVQDLHLESTHGPATLTLQAAGLLRCEEHLLPEAVLHNVLVLRLEAGEGLQQLDLLVHEDLVELRQVLQSWRTARDAFRHRHPLLLLRNSSNGSGHWYSHGLHDTNDERLENDCERTTPLLSSKVGTLAERKEPSSLA